MSGIWDQVVALPPTVAAHLRISVVALLLGVAIGMPLSIGVVRRPRWGGPVLGAVAVIQTIPSLALLALSVPVLAAAGWALEAATGLRLSVLGFLPAVGALTLYSLLPIVRNTVTGLRDVDGALVEAARAVGMTEGQVLREVQLPLAAPVILAGLRTATVWVVGIATLATPVGQTCLGDPIFAGLQTRNHAAVVVGCVAAAGLAIGLDALLAWVERASGAGRRVAGGALAVVVGLGLIGPALVSRGGDGAPVVVIGAKNFTEQYVLAAALQSSLEGAGYAVVRKEGLGSSVVFDAVVAGDVDVVVDYSGTLWANQLGRSDVRPADEVLRVLGAALAERGVTLLGPLGFENAYAIAVRRADADGRGWRSVADLAGATDVRVGADYEFFDRPEWKALTAAYALAPAEQRRFDPTFLYEAVARGEVDAISAFTSDGRIAAFDLVTLDDPRHALPPYDAVLLLSRRAAADPAVVDALRRWVGAVDVAAMREANRLVDQEGRSVQEAARTLWRR